MKIYNFSRMKRLVFKETVVLYGWMKHEIVVSNKLIRKTKNAWLT